VPGWASSSCSPSLIIAESNENIDLDRSTRTEPERFHLSYVSCARLCLFHILRTVGSRS
jgi:hypothetical protein